MQTESSPSISVVIPAYNAERFLSETVNSVLAQTVSDWEMVIVDDGSRDGTLSLARELSAKDGRLRVVAQENAGVSAARNAGYRASSPNTEYVIFLDADDLWEPDALEVLSNTIRRHPEALAVHGSGRFMSHEGELIRPGDLEAYVGTRQAVSNNAIIEWPKDGPSTFETEAISNYIATMGMVLIRRSALERVGLFDTEMKVGEDWDLWLRICRVAPMPFVNQALLRYRQHSSSAMSNGDSAGRANDFTWQKILKSYETSPEHHRILVRGHRHLRRLTAAKRFGWLKQCLDDRRWMDAVKQSRHIVLDWAASFRNA